MAFKRSGVRIPSAPPINSRASGIRYISIFPDCDQIVTEPQGLNAITQTFLAMMSIPLSHSYILVSRKLLYCTISTTPCPSLYMFCGLARQMHNLIILQEVCFSRILLVFNIFIVCIPFMWYIYVNVTSKGFTYCVPFKVPNEWGLFYFLQNL